MTQYPSSGRDSELWGRRRRADCQSFLSSPLGAASQTAGGNGQKPNASGSTRSPRELPGWRLGSFWMPDVEEEGVVSADLGRLAWRPVWQCVVGSRSNIAAGQADEMPGGQRVPPKGGWWPSDRGCHQICRLCWIS
jgi:hypothetical protein